LWWFFPSVSFLFVSHLTTSVSSLNIQNVRIELCQSDFVTQWQNMWHKLFKGGVVYLTKVSAHHGGRA
jgi:hypothetical protein